MLKNKEIDQTKGILSDQIIRLIGVKTSEGYPKSLRRVVFFEEEMQRKFVFLTNNFKLSASTVAKLYKSRWGIETLFKWIKQNLKIKLFWEQSENAVKTQIWIAISAYLVVIIARKKLNLPYSPYEILQLISLAPFDHTPMTKLFENANYQDVKEQKYNQLTMF